MSHEDYTQEMMQEDYEAYETEQYRKWKIKHFSLLNRIKRRIRMEIYFFNLWRAGIK
jgi:hypothetical protein